MSSRATVDELDCGITVLVDDDGLASVEAAWLVLDPILLTVSVPCDVPMLVVVVIVVGMAVVDPELDVSRKINIEKKLMKLSAVQPKLMAYVLQLMRRTAR